MKSHPQALSPKETTGAFDGGSNSGLTGYKSCTTHCTTLPHLHVWLPFEAVFNILSIFPTVVANQTFNIIQPHTIDVSPFCLFSGLLHWRVWEESFWWGDIQGSAGNTASGTGAQLLGISQGGWKLKCS